MTDRDESWPRSPNPGSLRAPGSDYGAAILDHQARHQDDRDARMGQNASRSANLGHGRVRPQAAGDVAYRIQAARCKRARSEEHTSELQSLMRISYAVFCLKKKNTHNNTK